MDIEDRLRELEGSFGGAEADKRIIEFNSLVTLAIYLIEKNGLKSQMSIDNLRALLKPYPIRYSDSELTPGIEKELDRLKEGLLCETQEVKDLWGKHTGIKYPFTKSEVMV